MCNYGAFSAKVLPSLIWQADEFFLLDMRGVLIKHGVISDGESEEDVCEGEEDASEVNTRPCVLLLPAFVSLISSPASFANFVRCPSRVALASKDANSSPLQMMKVVRLVWRG